MSSFVLGLRLWKTNVHGVEYQEPSVSEIGAARLNGKGCYGELAV